MTTLQIKLAVAIKDFGSISNAAKALEISQPNASNYIKALEQELGFSVFQRARTGVEVTPKGEEFLIYARQMLEMNDKAMKLRDTNEVYRLRLGTVNYYTAVEPFFELCTAHRDNAKNDFCLYNVSVSDGIQKLLHHSLDVVAVPIMRHQVVGLIRECKLAGIEMHDICDIPAVIMVRKNHPAAFDGRCMNIVQGSDAMKEFPYVGMRNLAENPGPNDYNDSDFIQCSYKILVDDTNMRLRMIEATNGFGFGILSSYKMMSQFSLDHFPVPNFSLHLYCLTLPNALKQCPIADYVASLKNEMSFLINNNG